MNFPWGPGLPQAGCIVYPKTHDVRHWSKLAAPAVLNLHVSMRSIASQYDLELPAWTSLDWSFVPQFVLHDDKGEQFATAATCGVLSLAQPTAMLWVWTGGHPVEASLGRQLQKASRGQLAVHVSEPPDTFATPPTISVAVVWDASVPFRGFEEVELRLESRVSGQVQTCTLRIDGSPAAVGAASLAALPAAGAAMPQLLLLCLVVCCLVGILYLCFSRLFGTARQARVFTQHPAAANQPGGMWAGHGAQAPTTFQPAPTASLHGSGQGPSPFRRVDMRPY